MIHHPVHNLGSRSLFGIAAACNLLPRFHHACLSAYRETSSATDATNDRLILKHHRLDNNYTC
ncbi:hypothetical protein BDA96_05G011600 [Sorghum bicolor]|uniref:Uncharacterized protein n=2 Tax=Sorghum bicolor TaxID=4558 RepID=A0A921QV49_SORBI|nr:hypothetical protein BDA96_05G011500 [Sorghum bicolor]KAG0528437.1 hypothetical protein BDA96_05G011600 [Sorghum bicolor]OQU83671.1 hypothetical protein SORBI_3005G157733 [Sorghum bicolor]